MKLPGWYTKVASQVERWQETKRDQQRTRQQASHPAANDKKPKTRAIHVGVDYGTSWSKLVYRDYEAPGGETSYVVFATDEKRQQGDFRYPSLVCHHDSKFWFGDDAAARAER